MNPKITILLPVFNGEGYINQSVLSVINQTFQDWELLVLNDGSTDRSVEIVKDFAKQDKRIRLINNPVNLGLIATLNYGLNASRSDIIARIDSDDFWNNTSKLQKQIDFLKSNPEYGLVGTRGTAIDQQGNSIFKLDYPTDDAVIRNQILKRNCFIHSSAMFHKDPALKFGGYNLNYQHIEDYKLWLQLGTVSKLANLPEHMVKYRVNQIGITQNNALAQIKSSIKLIEEYKKQYPNYLFAKTKLGLQNTFLQIFGKNNWNQIKTKLLK